MPERQKPKIRAKYAKLPVIPASSIGFEVMSDKELELRQAEARKHTARVRISLPKAESVSPEEWAVIQKYAVSLNDEKTFFSELKDLIIAILRWKPL